MNKRAARSKKAAKRGNYKVKGVHSPYVLYSDWIHSTRMTTKQTFWKDLEAAYGGYSL